MNELKLDFQEAIIRLREKGWSRRAIARELGINRETVGRYLRLSAKPATELPAGSELQNGPEKPVASGENSDPADSKPAKVPAGFPSGSRSLAARWEEKILAKLDADLSAQRIYQDLVAEEQFPASYDSVKRFIRALERSQPLPFRRMECAPGQEVQVDFGAEWLLDRARLLGLHSATWAEAMMKERGLHGIRALQGFLQLAAKHAPANVEAAAELALAHGVWHLQELKNLLQNPAPQECFEFARQHPLIRELSHYQALMPDCFASSMEQNTETNETNQ